MGQAALTSFIADVALTETGEIKIYELGRLFSASATCGYEAVTGNNAYHEAGRFYKSVTGGLPVYQDYMYGHGPYEYDERYTPNGKPIDKSLGMAGTVGLTPPGDNFNPESLHSHAAVYIPYHPPNGSYMKSRMNAETDDQYFLIADSNAILNMAYNDKAVTTALFNLHAPHLLPRSGVYDTADISAMLDDFRDHSKFVVKRTEEANGDGVFFVNKKALQRWHNVGAGQFYLNYIAGIKRTQSLGKTLMDAMTFRNPGLRKNFNVTAQATVPGKTVRSGLFRYSTATRAIMSAVHDEGETTLTMHGTYHKLPKWPKGFGLTTRASMLSSMKGFRNKPNARVVDETDQAHMRDVLQKGLHKAFHEAFNTDPAVFAAQCLDAQDTRTRLAAMNVIHMPEFYDPQAAGNARFSNTLQQRFVNAIAEDETFARHAMRYVKAMYKTRATDYVSPDQVEFYKACEKAWLDNHTTRTGRLWHHVTRAGAALDNRL